ncbi:YdiU family protein [Aestuariibacter sp. AA17]|uniref:Protein nucleotidyltransferase YdiU n=1 Tax=Fluctibacter corallii TaxID=2984329 RepID=A0ABT3AD87_9ALTE|nr:YdiU family protein [Aestuariibacter sp. AA17]MCV2886216.1 YdiU family protein [Aestuariibacter sp. AA17]
MKLVHSYADSLANIVSSVSPQPIQNASLRAFNTDLANTLEIPKKWQNEQHLLDMLFTSEGLLAKRAVAQKYGGHQFGSWNPELGDGRGLLLGEIITSTNQHFDLHLKGAGKTPYSRFGDGRAVLRSTIREYLASEALHYLGIPSSRALCLFDSSTPVQREQIETAAMLIRTCESHIRFGHFEYFYHSGQKDKLDALFDYCFHHFFQAESRANKPHLALLNAIIYKTADLIALWQAQGFCHGVMNTDNMSIHGITFDYGPYAFLDDYDPSYICNHSDHTGRYAFEQQPGIALWNLNALAHAFSDYLSVAEITQALESYQPRLIQTFSRKMRAKLGLVVTRPEDNMLLQSWLTLLESNQSDYTQSFRLLCHIHADSATSAFTDHFINRDEAKSWLNDYQQRLRFEKADVDAQRQLKQQHNPMYVLRNYLAQHVIEHAENGDFEPFTQYVEVLKRPYDEQPEQAFWAKPPPSWGKGMDISCSS